jgi:protoheme ferro-lyase
VIGYKRVEIFGNHGGETLHMAEALNDSDEWVEGLYAMVKDSDNSIAKRILQIDIGVK